MIAGYLMFGSDSDTFMYEGVDHSNPALCTKCGYLKDFDYHNPFHNQRRKSFDISHPYDLGMIASLKFKEFCERNGYEDVSFKEFEQLSGFYQMILAKEIPFTARDLKKYCEVCGNYEEAISPKPLFSS